MRKSRRKIYFVRQGIQGGFALLVSVAILLGGMILSAYFMKELKFRLTTCMTFTHIKWDSPIEMVKDVVYKYSLYGISGIAVLALVTGKLLLRRIRKGISVLADEIEEFTENGVLRREDVRTPYEVALLRERFSEFAKEHASRMEKVGHACDEMRNMIGKISKSEDERKIDLLNELLVKVDEVKMLVGND